MVMLQVQCYQDLEGGLFPRFAVCRNQPSLSEVYSASVSCAIGHKVVMLLDENNEGFVMGVSNVDTSALKVVSVKGLDRRVLDALETRALIEALWGDRDTALMLKGWVDLMREG